MLLPLLPQTDTSAQSKAAPLIGQTGDSLNEKSDFNTTLVGFKDVQSQEKPLLNQNINMEASELQDQLVQVVQVLKEFAEGLNLPNAGNSLPGGLANPTEVSEVLPVSFENSLNNFIGKLSDLLLETDNAMTGSSLQQLVDEALTDFQLSLEQLNLESDDLKEQLKAFLSKMTEVVEQWLEKVEERGIAALPELLEILVEFSEKARINNGLPDEKTITVPLQEDSVNDVFTASLNERKDISPGNVFQQSNHLVDQNLKQQQAQQISPVAIGTPKNNTTSLSGNKNAVLNQLVSEHALNNQPIKQGQKLAPAQTGGLENIKFNAMNNTLNLNALSLNYLQQGKMENAPSIFQHLPLTDFKQASSSGSNNFALPDIIKNTASRIREQFSYQIGMPAGGKQWGNQLTQRLTWLAGQGIQTADLQLNPPELGPLQVRIESSEQAARVSFAISHPATRDVLESQIPRLRDLFSDRGLDLLDVDVGDHEQSENHFLENTEGDAHLGDGTKERADTVDGKGSIDQITETDAMLANEGESDYDSTLVLHYGIVDAYV